MKIIKVDASASPSAADVVFESLRRAVITGDLPDGHALRQEELARHFNTSRIPVREALTRLEQHGLVQIRRHHGYTVAGLSSEQIEEICRFRALLEAEIVAQAVPRMSNAALAQAKKCCEAFAKERDPVRWGDLNRDFHFSLYRESNLPYHVTAASSALEKTERYLVDQLRIAHSMTRARAEHKAILEACIARDANAAARLTRDHILAAHELFARHLGKHPGAAIRRPHPSSTGDKS